MLKIFNFFSVWLLSIWHTVGYFMHIFKCNVCLFIFYFWIFTIFTCLKLKPHKNGLLREMVHLSLYPLHHPNTQQHTIFIDTWLIFHFGRMRNFPFFFMWQVAYYMYSIICWINRQPPYSSSLATSYTIVWSTMFNSVTLLWVVT